MMNPMLAPRKRSMSVSLLSQVRLAWNRLGSPSPGLIVAVSGGPDSVALLRALLEVRPCSDIPLVVAHLNHLLRGSESDADETFVRELHARLSVQADHLRLVCHRLDLSALARQEHANLEAIARRERYRWLAEVAVAHGLRHVVTGHTANDQAETVLHRLLRGTGIEGLRGIAFRRPLTAEVEVVRPLLQVTRKEVEAYLEQMGQPARQDSSNEDLRLTRNRLRHELLPLLARDYNPRIAEVLTRLAQQAEELAQEQQTQASQLLREAEHPREGQTIVLNTAILRGASRSLVRACLRLIWQREGWSCEGMGFVEYERLADLVFAERGAHDLPGLVHARRRGKLLRLSPRG